MPPSSLSESLGIGGGQSLGDFLSLSDTPTIRKKYYDTIDSGLGSSSESPQLDQGNLLWQGIIPALATALLTKGKSFGVSGGPLLNVLGKETERAKEAQKFSVDAKLKGAGLLGDTLDKRDTLAAAAVGREETLRQAKDLKQETLRQDEKQDIRADDTKRYTAEANAVMRNQFHEDSMAQQTANRDALVENRTLLNQDRDLNREKSGRLDVKKTFNDRAKELNIGKQAQAVVSLQSLLSGDVSAIDEGQISSQIARASTEVGNISAAERKLFIPDSAPKRLKVAMNFITGGAEGTLTPEIKAGLKEAVDAYTAIVQARIQGIRKETEDFYGEDLPIPREQLNQLGNSYLSGAPGEQTPTIGQQPNVAPAQQINPNKRYQSKNGTVLTGAMLTQKVNPATFSQWTEIE